MPAPTTSFAEWLTGLLQDLVDALTIEEALHTIMERLQARYPNARLAVIVVDENTNELMIKIARGISYSFVKQFRRKITLAVIPRVLLKHEPLCLARATLTESDYQAVRLEQDFQQVCLMPLILHERAVGYLHCERGADCPFTAEESAGLQVIGFLIGLLMEKFILRNLAQHLERVDTISKALKYHAFLEEYYRELARAKMYQTPLSLLFIDIDNYSTFVATCGIPAGHALLEEICRLITQSVRDLDIVGRFSADQFIVGMNGISHTDALAVAEAIRQQVQERATASPSHKVTVSIVAMTFARPEELAVPVSKVLAALGSGLITLRVQKGTNHVLSVAAPRV